ncbi:hypothetical protein BASA81_000553 [Batrachochytrium salamandrivorans]|nr:hypothetical protein BASA81_000553 [Batrachochytrium salamandrivorans]
MVLLKLSKLANIPEYNECSHEAERLSGDEEEIRGTSCPHLNSLLRASKVQKSISKRKAQIDHFQYVCLHCADVFTSQNDAKLHSAARNGHFGLMSLSNGEITCSSCEGFPQPVWLKKKSQQREFADMFTSLNSSSTSKQEKKKSANVVLVEEEPLLDVGEGTVPRGLKNLGNTCFFNSSLQLLIGSRWLTQALTRSEVRFGPLSSAMRTFLTNLPLGKGTANPKSLLNSVCELACNHLGDGAQHDAQELLMFLLAGVDDEAVASTINTNNRSKPCPFTAEHEWRTHHAAFWFPGMSLELIHERVAVDEGDEDGDALTFCYAPPLSSSSTPQDEPIVNISKDLFQLEIDSIVTCEHCRHVSKKREMHSMLSLALSADTEPAEDLAESLRLYFSTPDKLLVNQNNGYRCDKCKLDRNAKRELKLYAHGPLLLLHLKRFRQAGNRLTKLQDQIPAPDRLYLNQGDNEQAMRLVGFVEHLGNNITRGHYIAYIQNRMGKWFRCSDESVTCVTRTQARAAQVYIALYEREGKEEEV